MYPTRRQMLRAVTGVMVVVMAVMLAGTEARGGDAEWSPHHAEETELEAAATCEASLRAWLSEGRRGEWSWSVRLEWVGKERGGRGLRTSVDGPGLRANETFLSLALHSRDDDDGDGDGDETKAGVIYPETASRAEGVPKPVVNEIDAFSLWMAVQRVLGSSSEFAPYLRCLPRDGADTAFRWNARTLAERLTTERYRREASAMRKAVQWRASRLNPPFSAKNYETDVSLVQSRVFRIASSRTEAGEWVRVPALVPVADMLNLVPRELANVDCRTSDDASRFVCFALADIPPGTELLAPMAGLPLTHGLDEIRDHVFANYGFDILVADMWRPFVARYRPAPVSSDSGSAGSEGDGGGNGDGDGDGDACTSTKNADACGLGL